MNRHHKRTQAVLTKNRWEDGLIKATSPDAGETSTLRHCENVPVSVLGSKLLDCVGFYFGKGIYRLIQGDPWTTNKQASAAACLFRPWSKFVLTFLLNPPQPQEEITLQPSLGRVVAPFKVHLLHQVVLGRPWLFLPAGVHLTTTSGVQSRSFLKTYPGHLNWWYAGSLGHPVQFFFEIFSDQKVRQIFWRHRLWKASNFSMLCAVTCQQDDLFHIAVIQSFVLRLFHFDCEPSLALLWFLFVLSCLCWLDFTGNLANLSTWWGASPSMVIGGLL